MGTSDRTSLSVFGMGKRSPPEIVVSILRVCKVPTKVTHIMYKSYTNNVTLDMYLETMVENGMIEKIAFERKNRGKLTSPKSPHTRFFYKTTSIGENFVRQWDELVSILITKFKWEEN